MPSGKRKRASPQRLGGENATKKREFSFFAPRTSVLQPVDGNSEIPLASQDALSSEQTPPDSQEPSQHVEPVVSIPIHPHSVNSKFRGIPIAKFSVTFENRSDLVDSSCTEAQFALLWAPNGQLQVKFTVGINSCHIPAKIEPSLSYGSASSVCMLAGKSKHARLVFSADGTHVQNALFGYCCREIELWISELLCEHENPWEAPKKSVMVGRCKSLVEAIYPGFNMTFNEGALGSPSKHQLSIVAKIRQFYTDVRQRRRDNLCGSSEPELDAGSVLPYLTAILRGYQSRAVAWMIRREGGMVGEGEEVEGDPLLQLVWAEIPASVTGLDHSIFFNPHTGKFSKRSLHSPWAKGGILADEMGLGKTVEVLALILAHKWPGEDQDGDRAMCDTVGEKKEKKQKKEEEEEGEEEEEEEETFKVEHNGGGNITECMDCHEGALSLPREDSLIVSISHEDTLVSLKETTCVCTDQDQRGSPALQTMSSQPVTLSPTDNVMMTLQHGFDATERDMDITEEDGQLDVGTHIQTILDKVAKSTSTCNHLVSPTLTVMWAPNDSNVSKSGPAVSPSPDSQARTSLSKSPQALNVSFQSSSGNSPDEEEGEEDVEEEEEEAEKEVVEEGSGSLRTDSPSIQEMIHREHSYSSLGKEKTNQQVTSNRDDGIVSSQPPTSSRYSEMAPDPQPTSSKNSEILGTLSASHEDGNKVSQSPSKVSQSPMKGGGSSGSQEVVRCLCGATSEGSYEGEFVQCERCQVWQHSHCADFHASRHDSFVCIKCLLEQPLPAGATLIISPESIVQQWEEEIQKHTQPGALRVLRYRGVSRMYVSPFELASSDIVLVTYEILRSEINHANSHEVSRVLRHRKRYTCYPSPLPAVKWWRICLDEAQIVESANTKAAEMTQKLCAVNRWCVTGTPVQRNLMDLYGLVLFLGVDPYSQLSWFNKLLWYPFTIGREEPLVSLFSRLMWRNSKADVADELQLPNQMEEIHWLNFSAIEAYFYRRQQQTCTADVAKVLAYLPDSNLALSSMLQSTVQKLMNPLHRLRQACCHPQIVRGGYLPINISNKNCMTMPELLEKLIMQAKVEAREALRQLVAALNGLAGICILKGEWECAVESYREAMLAWQEHEEYDVDCDKLQRIHTMENLAELLREGRAGDSHTLRDDRLVEDAKELRDKYMEKPEAQVKAAVEGLVSCKQAIEAAKLEVSSCPWWLSLLEWVEDSAHTQEMLEAINTELSSSQDFSSAISQIRFSGIHGVQLLLCSHMDKIEECRGRLLEALDKLSAPPSEDLVEEVANCHLRPGGSLRGSEVCQLCATEVISIELESLLFAKYHTTEESHNTRSEHGDGSRAQSIFEKILRCLLSFAKHKSAPSLLLKSAQAFLVYLEALKKEYKAMRSLWIAADKCLCVCDELHMASSRLRFMAPHEIILGLDVPFAINLFEVDTKGSQFHTDKLAAQCSLKKCVGQVLYLKNLTKTQGEHHENSEPCPVCTRCLGKEWGVFTCGHPLCMECVFTMVNMQRRYMHTLWGHREEVPIKCPLCRVPSLSTEINYVRTGDGENQKSIKGSHSTKIVGITQVLLHIQQHEPGAKSLVFSSWLDVLELIAHALRENDIKFSFLKIRKTFQRSLTEFKTSPDVNVLLLPFHSGSKGLNIIEATHVLLVEPLLNTGVELQAVGRVHRMGQTKPTTVHKFYIRDSVEERIYKLLNSQADKTKFLISNERESALTVAEIQCLFQD